MKLVSLMLLSGLLLGQGCSVSETKTESTAVMVTTSLNGIPLIYLQTELPLDSLPGNRLSEIQSAFDAAKVQTNEKSLGKASPSYYLVYPDRRYIKIVLEDQIIVSATDHGENASSMLMNAVMKELDENKSVEDNAGQPPPASQANTRRASP